MRNKKFLIFLLVAVAVIMAAIYFRGQNKPEGIEVTTEKVEKRTIKEMVGASGKVFPETEIKISSDVSGELEKCL